jgi:3-oxoacid CoA-transferase A subunit
MKPVNKIMGIREAISRVKDGSRIMVGGFGLRGTPDPLVEALVEHGAKELVIISNDLGSPGIGLGKLLRNKQIKSLIGNFYNWNTEVADAYNAGEIGVTLVPQGTFAESIRAAGVGIPAYYTPTSAGTELGKGKDVRKFNGKDHVLEEAIKADVALVKAYKADSLGNLIYCKVARNFNPAMAMAADYTIALVDEIVEPGNLDPESIVTPHIFVNAIVKDAK